MGCFGVRIWGGQSPLPLSAPSPPASAPLPPLPLSAPLSAPSPPASAPLPPLPLSAPSPPPPPCPRCTLTSPSPSPSLPLPSPNPPATLSPAASPRSKPAPLSFDRPDPISTECVPSTALPPPPVAAAASLASELRHWRLALSAWTVSQCAYTTTLSKWAHSCVSDPAHGGPVLNLCTKWAKAMEMVDERKAGEGIGRLE